MRFSTVAILATGALASVPGGEKPHGHGKKVTTSTVYATVVKTVSQCPPEVTKCPYADKDKVKVVTETVSSYTTVCTVDDDDDETTTKKPTSTSTYKPHPPVSTPCDDDETSTYKPHPPSTSKSPEWPEKPEEPKCPYTKVKTITTSVTTVVPTVIYETYTEECGAKPTGPAKPTGGYEHGNGSSPAKPTKPVTAGAGAMVGSTVFALVAGVAAFAFA